MISPENTLKLLYRHGKKRTQKSRRPWLPRGKIKNMAKSNNERAI